MSEGSRSGGYLGRPPSSDPLVVRTARLVRRVGFVVLAIVCLWTVIPIFIGVIGGLIDGEVNDPVSQQRVERTAHVNDCTAWGLELLVSKEQRMDERAVWKERCGPSHPRILSRMQ